MPSQAKVANRLAHMCKPPPNTIDLLDLEPDPLLDALRFEGASLREWVGRILAGRSDLAPAVEEFFERYGEAIEDLLTCPAIVRLGAIQQLGIKRNPPASVFYDRPGRVSRYLLTVPYLHTRLMHVVQVAAHVVAGAVLLGLHPHLIATGAFAALLHDVGYGAYGHDGDDCLVAWGEPGHEARGQALVERDPDILESLGLAHLNPKSVIVVMRERGFLGGLLSVCDTLAYVQHDARMAGRPLPDRFGYEALVSIVELDETHLRVERTAPLRQMLIARAILSRDIYFSLHNQLASAALRTLLDFLRREERLTPAGLMQATDSDVERFLSGNLPGPRVAEKDALRCLAFGFWDQLERWIHVSCSPERLQEEFRLLFGRGLSPILQIHPFDFTRKTVLVELPSGSRQELKASSRFLEEEHRLAHVFALRT